MSRALGAICRAQVGSVVRAQKPEKIAHGKVPLETSVLSVDGLAPAGRERALIAA